MLCVGTFASIEAAAAYGLNGKALRSIRGLFKDFATRDELTDEWITKRLDSIKDDLAMLNQSLLYGKKPEKGILLEQNLFSSVTRKSLEFAEASSSSIRDEFGKGTLSDKYLLEMIEALHPTDKDAADYDAFVVSAAKLAKVRTATQEELRFKRLF